MNTRSLLLASAAAVFLTGLTAAAPQDAPVVRIDAGQIRGELKNVAGQSIRVFRGIPFAAPPTGSLRWRAPQRVSPWTDVRDATRFAPACPQAAGLAYGAPFPDQSEDCLYLNVWSPWPAEAGPRPVMVWIHGGGNVIGGAHTAAYDGSHLAAAGVVLVTIQYRLGPLGFLAHPALTSESRARDGRASSGNYGLLDQIAALEWVKANIMTFGGDRDRVTVFGESAGAADITNLMASPLARGLFHRAIAESGYFGENVPRLNEAVGATRSAHQVGLDVAARLDIRGEDEQALRALRALPPDVLTKIPMTIGGLGAATGGAFKFGPIVDGYVLPKDPGEVWAAGEMHKVPFIAGSNLDDGSVFVRSQPIRALPGYKLMMSTIFGPDADAAMAVMPATTVADVPAAVQRIATVLAFRAPARRLARAVDAPGGTSWLYLFSRNPLARTSRGSGVIHGLEIPYVFGTIGELGPAAARATDMDRALSADMLRRWAAFARTGNPNGADAAAGPARGPVWPAYHREDDRHLEFGDSVTAGSRLDREACDLVDRATARRRGPGK
jgi:para-nitrobenzyl esterase